MLEYNISSIKGYIKMKRFILILLFVFLLISISTITVFASKQEDYKILIDKAVDNIYDDKYNGALNNINKAIKINPDAPDAYFTRAGIYMIRGRYKDAFNDYKKVTELAPDNSKDAEFFGELAKNAVIRPNTVKFHKFNVVFLLGDGEVIPENNKQEELVNKIVYAKGLIEGHSDALKNYCSSTGVIPNKYLMLDSKAFKKTIANIDKIINNFDEETAILFEINYKYNVKKYDKIHENSYEDMRKYMLEKNYELTKAVYCDGFVEEAEFFIKKKIERIKNEVPDLYLD